MNHTITTITDAIQIIRNWTESYSDQPSGEEIRGAAIELVAHIGGYGNDLTSELSESFNLESALYE